ncbi:DUF6997 domain-containing protein [Natrinema caseinilyticum]|uniref:DUF6997 domain-containing protein n=1 Tax=Natrinema caseinilyticum TaxID=2961570 RepID=UPI0020C3D751|nr:hypothetical protein [Natrinema caseinilyticum]
MSHWDPALRSLQDSKSGLYGPESFIGYLRDIGQDPNQYRTADELSIDTRAQLSDRLDEQETMVLRLGRASNGPGTQFSLVNVSGQLDDFFIDESEFNPDDRQVLDYSSGGDEALALRQSAQDMLEVYRSLPTFSETSFVNFALSTGIFSRALDLDTEQIGTAPTTVASTFDFEFEPHPNRPTIVHHNGGQVEIDALIVARRGSERILLVVEAKCGAPRELAKHKLGYPVLAARTSLSLAVDRVVPVYLRAQTVSDAIRYSIYECSELPAGETRPCLAGLHVVDDQHYEVRIDQSDSYQQRLA